MAMPPPGGVADASNLSALDRYFGITRHGSTMGREIRGGLVTFFSMAYIIALNPLIVGTAADKNGNLVSGPPKFSDAARTVVDTAAVNHSIGMVATATAFVAGIMTILMGVWGRFPIGLAAGLGLNAMVAYVLAPQMTWPQAMGLIVWEGILITVLVLTGVREAIFRAVPRALRTAISVGIGLFITFVGLLDSGVVSKPAGSVPVQLGPNGSLVGWPIAVCVIGLLILLFLSVRKVKGAMFWSIIATTVLAVVVEAIATVGAKGPDNPVGWSLNVPHIPAVGDFALPNLGLLGRVDLLGAFSPGGKFSVTVFLGMLLLVFSLLLADFFDTVGTVVAVGSEAKLLDEHGNPERLRDILLIDSLAAMAGGLGSVSSNTSFVESTSGVGDGARTGLASVVTGAGFLVAMFLAPVVKMVPSEAVAPVLTMVGFLMMSQIVDIRWDKLENSIPAFLTIIFMPFAYSITTGIGMGFIVWVLMKVFSGKARRVNPLLWVVSGLFVIYFAQALVTGLIAKI